MLGSADSDRRQLHRSTPLSRASRLSLHILIGLLAMVGAVAIMDTPIVSSKLDSVTAGSWTPYLDRFDHYLKYGAIGIAAISATLAILKLDKIISAFRGYRDARAPIYELAENLAGIKATLESLQDTMGAVQKTSAELSQQANKIKELQAAIEKTDQAVKDAVDQLADMERLAAVEIEVTPASGEDDDATPDQATEAWEELRSIWNANARRLDRVRSNIEDGRIRARFMRMPRNNYKKIINALAHEGYISETAKTKSLELHRKFMSRRKIKTVSAQEIGDIVALDAALEHDLATHVRRTERGRQQPGTVNNPASVLV